MLKTARYQYIMQILASAIGLIGTAGIVIILRNSSYAQLIILTEIIVGLGCSGSLIKSLYELSKFKRSDIYALRQVNNYLTKEGISFEYLKSSVTDNGGVIVSAVQLSGTLNYQVVDHKVIAVHSIGINEK